MLHVLCYVAYVVGCCAAAAAYNIYKMVVCKGFYDVAHVLGCFVVATKGVWQACIGVAANITSSYFGQFG